MQYYTLTPAYGRDYKSVKAVKADWEAGKDFQMADMYSSGYVNREDAPRGAQMNIRYSGLRKVCVIKT